MELEDYSFWDMGGKLDLYKPNQEHNEIVVYVCTILNQKIFCLDHHRSILKPNIQPSFYALWSQISVALLNTQNIDFI